MRRKYGIAVLAVAGFTGLAAYYGGWATVTVENLPEQLVVAAPYNLTFSIRQHGEELLSDLSPYIQLKSGRQELVARAVETNRPGYYTATVEVPAEGDWSATIQTSFGKSHLRLMPLAALPRGARLARVATQAERGQRLFVAKGCVVCHQHAKTAAYGFYKVGPELTDKRFAAGYLREFLADPSIKPPTTNARMPQLNLSKSEIGALAAFINSESSARSTAGN
jgi:cytochrome c551/c552